MGYSSAAESFIDRIYANPQWGYRVCGILDDNKESGYTYKGVPVLGPTDELETILENNRLDEIALTLALREYYKLKRIVAICEKSVCIQNLFRIIMISYRRDHIRKIFWAFR